MADANYADVVLLLPMDGSDGSTSASDYSTKAKQLTCAGTAQISNGQAKYGSTSLRLNTSGTSSSQYAYISDGLTDFTFAGDFTVEFWLYAITLSTTGSLFIDTRNTSVTASSGWYVATSTSGTGYKIQAGYNGAFAQSNNACPLNTWTHVKMVRSGTTVTLYLDDVAQTTTGTISGSIPAATFNIGRPANGAAGYGFSGYVDDMRITKVARSSGNSTPPGALCKTISGTVKDDANANAIRSVTAVPRISSPKGFSTTSASDGTYSLFIPDVETSVLFLDDTAGTTYNDLVVRI